MKADQLRDLTVDELNQKYRDYKDELFNLRFQSVTGQLKDNMRLRSVKQNIARIKTVLRERELDVGAVAAGGGQP
ncbi:MAG: 50S ribosomal protein L29 [bacterium]|nr:50S ribosomal protein L29 [bacterium]